MGLSEILLTVFVSPVMLLAMLLAIQSMLTADADELPQPNYDPEELWTMGYFPIVENFIADTGTGGHTCNGESSA